MKTLKIRKNGSYYQVGYYELGKWINVYHIGTPEQLLKKLNVPMPETYQKVKIKDLPKSAETYQENDDKEKSTLSEQIASRFG